MYQVEELTEQELREVYQGLPKEVLIDILIGNKRVIDQLEKERDFEIVYGECPHDWVVSYAGMARCRLCGISSLACMGEEIAGW